MRVKPLSLKPLVTSLPSLMVLCISVEKRFFCVSSRGGVARPRTQKNFEAKDTDASVLRKKRSSKSLKIFFGRKRSQKFFFRRSLLEETKKKVYADFKKGLGTRLPAEVDITTLSCHCWPMERIFNPVTHRLSS